MSIVAKKVMVFKTDGEYVDTFTTISQAALDLNLDQSAISRCLSGTRDQTKGYTFVEVSGPVSKIKLGGRVNIFFSIKSMNFSEYLKSNY